MSSRELAERRIADGVAALLPTPTASDRFGPGAHGDGSVDLRTAVSLLPTPRATDGLKGGPNQSGSSGDVMLPSAVMRMLPTPSARDWKSGASNLLDANARPLNEVATNLLPAPSTSGAVARPSLDALAASDEWGEYGDAIRQWTAVVDRAVPAPTMIGRRGGRVLAPPFVEWLMGLPAGHVTDVPDITRNDKLRLLGNGVVPRQAEAALRLLLPRVAEGVAA